MALSLFVHMLCLLPLALQISSCYCLLGSKSAGGSGLQTHRKTPAGQPGEAANSKLEFSEVSFTVTFDLDIFWALQLGCCSISVVLEYLIAERLTCWSLRWDCWE